MSFLFPYLKKKALQKNEFKVPPPFDWVFVTTYENVMGLREPRFFDFEIDRRHVVFQFGGRCVACSAFKDGG